MQSRKLAFHSIITFQFIQIVFCQTSVENNQIVADENLIFAHTLCRHGDRNPDPTYPNDRWDSNEYWPGGLSALTNIGKQQEYELGLYFRKRYARLIGNGKYSSDKIYIRSTDYERTLMSAAAALAGLFPPTGTEVWNRNIGWQPISIHTIPEEDDFLLAIRNQCDRYDYLMNKYVLTQSEYIDLFNEHKQLLKFLEIKSGKSLATITSILLMYSALHIEELKSYPIPPWSELLLEDNGPLSQIMSQFYSIWVVTAEMKMFKSGFLLKEILDRSRNKTKSILSPDRSLWMYSGHDINIATMLHTLQLNSAISPPYASCLLFELHQSDGQPYIQIFYRNSTETNLPAMEIPNCGTKCPLYRMYELYDDVLPKQSYERECQLRDGETYPPGGNPEMNELRNNNII